MRICVLIDAWEPVWGGGQTHVWEIARQLIIKHNYEVDIYTRSLYSPQGKLYKANEIHLGGKLRIFRVGWPTHFFDLRGRVSWLVRVLFRVVSEHHKEPYDIIHGHAYWGAIPTKLLGFLLSLPTVFTVHGSLNLDQKHLNLLTIGEWLILTRIKFSAEISVSRSFLKYRNANRAIFFIPNGVDVSEYTNSKFKRRRFKTCLLFVGRLEEQKGVDLLIEAMCLLIRKLQLELLVVGEGRQRKYLENLTYTLRLGKNIKFLGKIPQTKLKRLYNQASLLVAPSRSEGLPFILLEAMAAKLPIVATNVGDNAYLIKDGVTGFIVNGNRPKLIAQTILRALNFPNLSKIKKNAYYLVQTSFSRQKTICETIQVYKQVIRRN